MKICISSIFFLVALLQPEESKCDPVDVKIGPALRPYSIIPVSNKLKTSITGNATSGGNVTLQVTLVGEADTITSCQWTSPEGAVFDINRKNDVVSVKGRINWQSCLN